MAKRRIKKAQITHISLVPRGKNKMPTLWKAEGGQLELQTLVKVSDQFQEDGLLTSLVYPAEREDSEGDIADARVVKQMAHDFIPNGANIDIKHNLISLSKDKVRLCENFLVQKGDPRFIDLKDYDGKPVDATDGWATVIKIVDPELRKLYREDGWQGVSMYGPAEVEILKEDDISDQIVEALEKRLQRKTTGDGVKKMDAKEFAELLAKNNEALITGLATALKAPTKTEAKKEEPVSIPFEGDVTDPDDVRAHLAKIELAKLDTNDPKAVASYLAKLEGKTNDGKASEIERLKKRLAKLEGVSNQPSGEDNLDALAAELSGTGLSKHAEQVKAGRTVAAAINKTRGFAPTNN